MKFIHYTADGRERACLSLEHAHSQQMEGRYTVGGASFVDFATGELSVLER